MGLAHNNCYSKKKKKAAIAVTAAIQMGIII